MRRATDRAIVKKESLAVENARLVTELRARTRDLEESLEYQTATSDLLEAISRSGTEVEAVLDTLVETAARLCTAEMAILLRRDGELYRPAAAVGFPSEYQAFLESHPIAAGRGSITGRVALEHRVIHVADVAADPEYTLSQVIEMARQRTALGVPLMRDGESTGVLVLARCRVEPFAERQIELIRTFADQAVIAIENARLLNELRDRTRDLQESLEYQTATSDVLKVISQSGAQLGPVLDTLVETAARICQAESGFIFRLKDGLCQMIAAFGISAEYKDFQARNPITPSRGTLAGRTVLERRAVHIDDAAIDPEYSRIEAVQLGHQRTMLGVPLLREDVLIGVITLARSRVEQFTEKQIELVRTFADQAVIAIENARLFGELRDRQAELRVTFDNMGDGVAMFDAGFRLAAWNRNLQNILDLPDDFFAQPRSYRDYIAYLIQRGEFGNVDLEAEVKRYAEIAGQERRLERIRPDGRVLEVRINPVPGGGFVVIYSDITERKKAEEQIRATRDAAEKALNELKVAQASLIQAEKMASLGQLTAGIAHEIKNPLNFVNNFAGLSIELLDELKAATASAVAVLDEAKRSEVDEVIELLTTNLGKVAEHGKRADGIVKSMLAHSRGSSGERQIVSINALVEESLNLAYHGARAQDRNFNITLERDLDPSLGPIEVCPQNIARVFINLFGNGFYAANKRRKEANDPDFRPVLKVTTRGTGGDVAIRIRDNGVGIPPENREKLFEPFFTTKPTGEGTGLGLSISYDVVTQEHGGTIEVDSEVGQYTEFTVRLPRRGGSGEAKPSVAGLMP